MDLKQLKYFVSVAELGGFTKAAEALSLTQPALSKKIRQLEMELHQNLLLRNGRGVSLTEEGTMLLSHAKGILEQAERARQEIADLKGSPTGKVIIGSPPAAKIVIAKLVASFKERFPKASLEITEVEGLSIYEWLSLGRLDIGILYDPPSSPSIEITLLRKDEVFLVSSASRVKLNKSSKIPFRQLSKYPLIMPSVPHTSRTLLEAAATKAGIKLNIVHQIEGGSFILELVHQGYGHTILPRHIVEESNLAGKLQINAIIKPRLARTLTVVVSSQRRVTYLSQETVKLIKYYFELGRA